MPLWPHQIEAAQADAWITTIAKARRTGGTALVEVLAIWTALGPFSSGIGHRDPDALDQITRTKRVLLVCFGSNRHPRSVSEHEDVAAIGMPHLVERAMEADARLQASRMPRKLTLAPATLRVWQRWVEANSRWPGTPTSTTTTGHAGRAASVF